jgi:putative membrane protein
MTITEAGQDLIEAAVADAEHGSRGEIVCVLAGEVSHYREIPLAWGAAAALAIPPLAVLLGLQPLALTALAGEWTIGHASALESQIGLGIAAYAAAQAVLFAAVAGLATIPAVRRVLTPGPLKAHRVRQAAQRQFAAVASRAQGSDTGVLIFVALVDHKVELVADKAIHERCGPALWKAAAEAVTSGMKHGDPAGGVAKAVRLCGDALREHFPAGEGDNPNILANRPLQI